MSGASGIRVRSLPAPLPPGERVLWQGAPRWQSLARRVFHVRKVAAWFALLVAWRIAASLWEGAGVAAALDSATTLLLPAVPAVGLLALLAWLMARSTHYWITSRRVIMRIGVALPMTVNVPFRIVRSAAFKRHADGTGDLPLTLRDDQRMGYALLWPHARPWRLARAEPMLRGVPDGERVSEILAAALLATVEQRGEAGGAEADEVRQAASPVPGGEPSANAA